jgi:hypothetical protein
MANPGAFMIIMTIIVWIGSMAGGLPYCSQIDYPTNPELHCTGNGLFYYDNFINENLHNSEGNPVMMYSIAAHFVNNYILAFLVSLMLGTYYFSIRRKMT